MSEWINQLNFELVILIANALIIFMLLFLLLKRGQQTQLNAQVAALSQALEQLSVNQKEFQLQLDVKLSSNQQQLFNSLLNDREKQLQSMSELSINLEKRFAQSGLQLERTVTEFKTQMVERFEQLKAAINQVMAEGQRSQITSINQFIQKIGGSMNEHQTQTRQVIESQISAGIQRLREDLERSIKQQSESIRLSLAQLSDTTDARLKEISGQVEKRLAEGFDKTNQTFSDVLQRLALIDDAQKKITELSTNVVSLQEILNDKRSRGAFGEIQLQSLISNSIPDAHYSMQQKLSNGKIADCVLLLPEPTGKIAIDAKFPLESFKRMGDIQLAKSDRAEARKQFARDIKKHIVDIAEKYILPPETSDGAVMFIPAESVFAEIHGHFPELVEFSQQKKVWLVSPTTLMAILTTACAVIKDEQTRKQVHVIKEHLTALSRDFSRFQGRMDNLAKHIGQVTKDVEQVHVSAKKITNRFDRIERVEVTAQPATSSLPPVEKLTP